jgi:hypothetical protein
MEYPYSNCIKDLSSFSSKNKTIFEFFKDLNIDYYDQEICASLCFQNKLIDSCGCSEIGIEKIRNTSYCTSMSQLSCLFSFLSTFYVSDNFICQNICQKECYQVEYDVQTNIVKYPNLNYLNYLRSENSASSRFPINEIDAEKFADNSFIKLMVNYETIEYVYVEENPKINLEILLGSIGGQLGLFIGISFINLIELFEILISTCCILIQYFRNYSRSNNHRSIPKPPNI